MPITKADQNVFEPVLATGSTRPRNLEDRFADVVNVQDFGALGNNSANDQPAIQAAIDYASFRAYSIYFPPGTYKIQSGIVFKPGVGCSCAPDATIIGVGSIDTVTISTGNYSNTVFNFPRIVGGKNGLVLRGVSLATIYVTSIALNENGLVLEIDNDNRFCADNNIFFTVINGSSKAGIKFNHAVTVVGNSLFQGNIIKGNFLVGVKYGIHFYDVNNGSLGIYVPTWDCTLIEVGAIDCAVADSIGIYGEPFLPPARFIVRAETFFGGCEEALIKGFGYGGLYRLAIPSAEPYSKNQLDGTGNQIINTSILSNDWLAGSPPYNVFPKTLTETPGQILTWNGGVSPEFNRFGAKIVLSSTMTAGTAKTFYFFSTFMMIRDCRIIVEPLWNVPLQVLFATQASTPGVLAPDGTPPTLYQGAVRLYAHENIPAGEYNMYITVSNVP